jgi:D-alanine-D-alanine ligase
MFWQKHMTSLSVGFVYDLKRDYLADGYSERDVAEFDSEETVDSITQALMSLGHRVDRIGHAKNLCRRLVDGSSWDLVFNISEGLRGRSREAQTPALLELYEIPYTFSDPLVSAVTLDKAVTKRLIRDAGLVTAPFEVVSSISDIGKIQFGFPMFAKPVAEGSSKGIDDQSLIRDAGQLQEVVRRLLHDYQQPVLVEAFLPGREFTVGMVGTGVDVALVGMMEVSIHDPERQSIYSHISKQHYLEMVKYVKVPRGLLYDQISALAVSAHRALECRDASRVDVRLDAGGVPNFIEINPMPGLHPTISDLPIIAGLHDIPYLTLIERIIQSASRRLHRDETTS